MKDLSEQYYTFQSPIGYLTIAIEKDSVSKVHLEQRNGVISVNQKISHLQHSDLLYETYCQLREYFEGRRREFQLPIREGGTDFQKQVWAALREIPYGETRSYQEIAMAIGNPKAVRAVGQANNRNPLLIVTPCHRVIHKNGDISGFACGIEVKRYLLELERTVCG